MSVYTTQGRSSPAGPATGAEGTGDRTFEQVQMGFLFVVLFFGALFGLGLCYSNPVGGLVLVGVCVLIGALLVHGYRSRTREQLAAREAAEAAARIELEASRQLVVDGIRDQLSALTSILPGADVTDFRRAAAYVIRSQSAAKTSLHYELGVSVERAGQLLHLLEQQEIVSPLRGSHRDIRIPAEFAEHYEVTAP